MLRVTEPLHLFGRAVSVWGWYENTFPMWRGLGVGVHGAYRVIAADGWYYELWCYPRLYLSPMKRAVPFGRPHLTLKTDQAKGSSPPVYHLLSDSLLRM